MPRPSRQRRCSMKLLHFSLMIVVLILLSSLSFAAEPISSGSGGSGAALPRDVFESVGGSGSFSGGPFGFIEDGFRAIFGFLLDPKISGGVESISEGEVLWIKILLWIGLFALLTSLFKLSFLKGRITPRAGNILAFVIAT